jgi:uncharacterized membrane protein
MNGHLTTIIAIIGMGLATYSTRISGLLLMRGVVVEGRLKAALDAVPPAVLMAVITPTAVTALAAYFKLPLLVTICAGAASVVLFRFLLT